MTMTLLNPENGNPIASFSLAFLDQKLAHLLPGSSASALFPQVAESADWHPDTILSGVASLRLRLGELGHPSSMLTQTIVKAESALSDKERLLIAQLPHKNFQQDGVEVVSFEEPVEVPVSPELGIALSLLEQLEAFVRQGVNSNAILRNYDISLPVAEEAAPPQV